MPALTTTIKLLAHNVGLTLYAKEITSAYAVTGAEITTGFVEKGNGFYEWTGNITPGATFGMAFFNDANDARLADRVFEPADFLTLADLELFAGLPAVAVTLVSAIDSDGNIEIVQGDEYYASESRALVFSSTNWPTLSGATVRFTARLRTDTAESVTADCEVVTATGSSKVVRFELPAEDTEGLEVGNENYVFDLEATLANGHVVTLKRGLMSVLSQVSLVEVP